MHPDGRVQRLRPAIGRRAAERRRARRRGRSSPRSPRAPASTSASLAGADGLQGALRRRAVLRRPDARRDRRPRRALAAERHALDVPAWEPVRAAACRTRAPRAACASGTFRTLWAAKEVDALARAAVRACPSRSSSCRPPTPSASASQHGEEVEVASKTATRVRGAAVVRAAVPAGSVFVRRGHRRRAGQPARPPPASRSRGHAASCVGGAGRRRAPSGAQAEQAARRRAAWSRTREDAGGVGGDAAARPPRTQGGPVSMFAVVGYYEAWWIQILKALIIFVVFLQILPVLHRRRAQAARPLPAPLRAQPRRPVRPAAAAGGDPEVRHQGADAARRRRRASCSRSRRSISIVTAIAASRGDPVLEHRRHLRHAGRALRDRLEHRHPLRVRVRRDRLLRADARRLGVRLEVLLPRRDALRRAADLLRGLPGPRARRRDHDRADAVADGDRHRPGRRHVVHRAAVRRLPRLPDRRLRGDQPRAVRPPRGRRRARAGLHDRVRRHAHGRVPVRRVPQPADRLRHGHDDLPRRLAAAVRHRPADVGRPVRRARQDRRCCCSSSSGSARRCRACATTS